jgi:CheY-like chemotaxis protein
MIGEHIDLIVVPHPALPPVKADPSQLHQALLNLILNARDAMPRGGQLTLETAQVELDASYARAHPEVQSGHYVRLAVRDTGCGMDERTRARIFEPFFTTKEVGKGTGLGLPTVYGIIKQSGGHIEVTSALGQGSTFALYLPEVAPEGRPLEPHPDCTELPRGTETVLLVEDEDPVRELAAQFLKKQGFIVHEAHRGGEALALFEHLARRIHLLVTDVLMPQMSGAELAERLTSRQLDLKVLYLSGYTDDILAGQGMLEAGTAFLQKPFTAGALVRKVREVLDTEQQA